MYRRIPFLIYIAVFILTWPAHFAVRGLPRSRNELCVLRGYLVACTFSADRKPCQVLKCGYRHRGTMTFHELILINNVPDFTECGRSKICMNGECVHVRGPMPHYINEVQYTRCHEVERHSNEHVRTRRQQCKDYGFDVACEAPDGPIDDDCRTLNCGYEGRNEFYYRRSIEKLPIPLVPDTGTWCGRGQACWNQSCITPAQWPRHVQRPTYNRPEVFDICCPEVED